MADGFVEAVLASPLGVSWLAVLEAGPDEHGGWAMTSPDSDPSTVAAAVDRIGELPFGTVIAAAVFAGVMESGPWMGDAPATIAAAYRAAETRVPIAQAIAERFSEELHAPMRHDAQQWWTDGAPWDESFVPLFRRFDAVYGAGEFTWAGLWTSTDPPTGALTEMVGAWELETGPISRWWLPVRPDARVYEIHRPDDWVRLVRDHPKLASPHTGWELPGVNQHEGQVAPLRTPSGRRAARTRIDRHLVPDWASVAQRHDGVHLSWAGFLTCEGHVLDLDGVPGDANPDGDGDVTMLRYWFSERTHWLEDAFGEPRPAPDPGIDLTSGHRHHPPLPPRRRHTHHDLARLLGRTTAG